MTAPSSSTQSDPNRPPGAPAGDGRGRWSPLIGLIALFLAAAVPLSRDLGANAEEVVGLLDQAPERLYPASEVVPASERNGSPGLRTSDRLPVWGWVDAGSAYHPLMIDSHVGALAFYPARWLAALGGLRAARAQSIILGVLAILAVYFLTLRLAGPRVALVAAALAASSAQLVVIYSFLRPDEQLSGLAAVAAVLAWCRFSDHRRSAWLYAGCALFGVAIAAKNTALWSLFAAVGAAAWFRLLPRARLGQWALAVVALCVPLVPQILYLLLRDPSGALASRLSMIAAPWDSLSPGGLAYQIHHFADSVGHAGTTIGGLIAGNPGPPVFYGAGYLLFAALLYTIAAAFSRVSTVPVRAFAAGLGLLLLEYLTLYYRGHSFFLLLAPWIPIAVALAGAGLWAGARGLTGHFARRLATTALVAAGLLIMANAGVELLRLRAAVARPGAALFDLEVQQAAADYLVAADIQHPYVTTYGGLGVFEVLSRGAVRPRYLFPFFAAVAEGQEVDYQAAWSEVLAQLEPGVHVMLLVPNPSPVDTSPCRRGDLIASQLAPVVDALDGSLTTRARYLTRSGLPILEIAEVWLPESRTASLTGGSDREAAQPAIGR